MFEVGRQYTFTTGHGREQATWSGKVTEADGLLIKVDSAGMETILNVGSPDFVKAEPTLSQEERDKRASSFTLRVIDRGEPQLDD